MKNITDLGIVKPQRPIKIVQFGEGNFLRAFVDYMVDITNEKTDFDAGIAIVKPISYGSLENFHKQNNLYTVLLRGREEGRVVNDRRIVTSAEKVIDAKEDYEELMGLARLDTLRFVVSNTTEAGIVLKEDDHFEDLPESYPGKLTKFLYERYQAFGGDPEKGLIILPVELIENNGGKLKECVLSLCRIWALPEAFENWVKEANVFCSTLVDRIVTGHPKALEQQLYEEIGYEDALVDIGEPFGLWVIETPKDISDEWLLGKAGLPVIFTDDQKPYRERKVRVLNGAHTSSVLAGFLYGLDIVRDCMQDEVVGKYFRQVVNEEIVPCVPLPLDEVEAFAASVFDRFDNPFIDHALLSISLNSVSKWKSRCLPSFRDYWQKYGELPKLLTFSFAALLAFYSGKELKDDGLHAQRKNGQTKEYVILDDRKVLEFFAKNCPASNDKAETAAVASFVQKTAGCIDFWGEDLNVYPGFTETVTAAYMAIRDDAVKAVQDVLK